MSVRASRSDPESLMYPGGHPPEPLVQGEVERYGTGGGRLFFTVRPIRMLL